MNTDGSVLVHRGERVAEVKTGPSRGHSIQITHFLSLFGHTLLVFGFLSPRPLFSASLCA